MWSNKGVDRIERVVTIKLDLSAGFSEALSSLLSDEMILCKYFKLIIVSSEGTRLNHSININKDDIHIVTLCIILLGLYDSTIDMED